MQARRPRFGNLLSCDEATRAAVPAVVVAGLVSEALNEVDTRLCPRRWRCGSGSSRAEALRRVLSVLSLAAERDLRLCEPRIAKHFTARRPRLRPGLLLGPCRTACKAGQAGQSQEKDAAIETSALESWLQEILRLRTCEWSLTMCCRQHCAPHGDSHTATIRSWRFQRGDV